MNDFKVDNMIKILKKIKSQREYSWGPQRTP